MQAIVQLSRAALLASLGALLAFPAVGCGSKSNPDADGEPDADAGPDAWRCEFRSGTRVRRIMRDHDDGTEAFLGLYDRELGEDCVFGPAADGSLRCLPEASGAVVAQAALLYGQSDCTDPIASIAQVGDTPPRYAMEPGTLEDDPCISVARYYRLGEELLVTGVTLYQQTDEGCVGVLAGDNPHYEVTGDLAPDELVAGTERWGGGRHLALLIEGEDGSRWCDVSELQDSALDEHPCAPERAEDGMIRCLPRARTPVSAYADLECSELDAFSVTSAECDSGYQYTSETAGTCGQNRIRARGAQVTTLYEPEGEGCIAQALEDGQEVYRVGPAVSGSSFGELALVYRDLGKRLERREWDDGELSLPTAVWRDSALDTPCAFRPAADGVPRCLPTTSDEAPVNQIISRFSDNQCMNPVPLALSDTSCTTGPPRFAYQLVDGNRVIYPVLGPAAGPLYQLTDVCAVIDVTDMYAVGAAIAPTMFVAGEEVVE
jgi:hypothetical protein